MHVATATFRFTSATLHRCVCDCFFSLSRDFMRLLQRLSMINRLDCTLAIDCGSIADLLFAFDC